MSKIRDIHKGDEQNQRNTWNVMNKIREIREGGEQNQENT
jgi:hypothetical protein